MPVALHGNRKLSRLLKAGFIGVRVTERCGGYGDLRQTPFARNSKSKALIIFVSEFRYLRKRFDDATDRLAGAK
jgi:hypothetical protein